MNEEIDRICEEIRAAAPEAVTPEDMKARLENIAVLLKDPIIDFRLTLLAQTALFIDDAMVAHPDIAKNDLLRLASLDLLAMAALVVAGMKRRLNEPPSAARFAFVAYSASEAIFKKEAPTAGEDFLDERDNFKPGEMRKALEKRGAFLDEPNG